MATIGTLAGISIAVAVVFIIVVFVQNHKLKKETMENYNVKLDKLFHSDTAEKLGIDNTTTDEATLLNMKNLIVKTLEPAYKFMPFKINSGYRSKVLNEKVKGSKTSQHCTGEAADITTGTKEGNRKLFEYIRENLPFDQLIAEYDFKVVHVSNRRIGFNRKQTLATNDLKNYQKI